MQEKYFLAISTKIPRQGRELEGEEISRYNRGISNNPISSIVVVKHVRMLYSNIYEAITNKGTYIVKMLNVPEEVRYCFLNTIPEKRKNLQCYVLKATLEYKIATERLEGKFEIVQTERMGFFYKIQTKKNVFYGLMPPQKESNP